LAQRAVGAEREASVGRVGAEAAGPARARSIDDVKPGRGRADT